MMIRLFIALACAFTTISSRAEETSRGIQIRLMAFAHFKNIDSLQIRDGASDLGIVRLPADGFGDAIAVKSRTLTYGVPADEFQAMGQIKLPDQGKQFVVIFAPTATGYRTFPIRTDDPDFRGDDSLVFNFSPFDIGVTLGTAKQLIPKSKVAKLRPAVPAGDTFFQATFYKKDKDTMKIFNDTRWPSNMKLRVFAFVFQDPVTGRMTYRDLRDLVE